MIRHGLSHEETMKECSSGYYDNLWTRFVVVLIIDIKYVSQELNTLQAQFSAYSK